MTWHGGNLLVGDVLERIKDIPDSSVDCVISSPPYWGLRDYGVEGQWGLEPHFSQFLDKLDTLMDEIKRILKPTGTVWINLGDTYSTQSGGMRDLADGKEEQYGQIKYTGTNGAYNVRQPKTNLKPKTRVGVPERFYIRCIDNGWIARNHVVWAKSNAMPTSVKDRFQNKWESIFFFAKKGKYFFNLDGVREEPISEYKPFNRRIRDAKKTKQMGLYGAIPAAKASDKEIEEYGNHQPGNRSNFGSGKDIQLNMERKWEKEMGQSTQTIAANHTGMYDKNTGELIGNPKGKNPGDIFFINPRPFVKAHFATFPPELPEKIIRCAVPERVCKKCGVPVESIMEPTAEYKKFLGKSWHDHENDLEQGMQQKMEKASVTASYEKVGEKICSCNAGFEPGVVFDPFMGSGTVAMVALQNARRWLGIEVNPDYVKIIQERLDAFKNNRMDEFFNES